MNSPSDDTVTIKQRSDLDSNMNSTPPTALKPQPRPTLDGDAPPNRCDRQRPLDGLRRMRLSSGYRIGAWICCALLISGCVWEDYTPQRKTYLQALTSWKNGEHGAAARQLLTLTELYPYSRWSEKGRFFSAELYQYYLEKPQVAIQLYRQFLLWHPNSQWANDAKYALVDLYRKYPHQRDKALYLLQDLINNTTAADRAAKLTLEMVQLNLESGNVVDAKRSLLALLKRDLSEAVKAHAYYMVSYVYLLEGDRTVAKALFQKTAERFPNQLFGLQAAFNVADILEDMGKRRAALQAFRSLKKHYPNKKLLDIRIAALQKTIKRSRS